MSGSERETTCDLCDNTGDIHSIDGEWRGKCPYCTQNEEEQLKKPATDEVEWLKAMNRALDDSNKRLLALLAPTKEAIPPYDWLEAPSWYVQLNRVWLEMSKARVVGEGHSVDDRTHCDWFNTINVALALSKGELKANNHDHK